ncbi:hypothetical protein [Anaerostipes faecalis]|uniref:hypothetical protein n=1 Tax=Anaerostipes faecalis TaxID=2738446 RepID=UPI003F0CABD2
MKAINNVPAWYTDQTNNYHLILTDDIDSLLSCAILKQVMGWNVEEIFLLKKNVKGHEGQDIKGKTKNATRSEGIGVDLALHKGKCFDNHITRFSANDYKNEESINPNLIENITRQNYTQKYAGSTVLLLWSLYDLQKEDLSEEAMMLLLAIDSAFLGYYNQRYRQHIRHYLVDVLDLPEFYNCIERHEKEEFYKIQDKYHLREKITLKKGHVVTKIDIDAINEVLLWDTMTGIEIELPQDRFYPDKYFTDVVKNIYGKRVNKYNEIIKKEPYCYALTKTNLLNYSIEVVA